MLLFWVIATGTSNAVNLADGLDGLATGASILIFAAYTLVNIWQNSQSCALEAGAKCYEVRDPLDLAVIAAALTGVLVGLVAGKPIWAKDAKIEAGMKAFIGALLAAGLMYAVRRFLTMPVPFPLGELAAPNESLLEPATSTGTIGGLAITSLAASVVQRGQAAASASASGRPTRISSAAGCAARKARHAGSVTDGP